MYRYGKKHSSVDRTGIGESEDSGRSRKIALLHWKGGFFRPDYAVVDEHQRRPSHRSQMSTLLMKNVFSLIFGHECEIKTLRY